MGQRRGRGGPGGDSFEFDFFVSRTEPDRPWAEWIAWQLEALELEPGRPCRVLLQDWDLVAGSGWAALMERGIRQAERIVPVLSQEYLDSTRGEAEWLAFLRSDLQGRQRRVVPVRVRDCAPEGLLGSVDYIDLVGLTETEAAERLLAGVHAALAGRARPRTGPPWPGRPGAAMAGRAVSPMLPGERDNGHDQVSGPQPQPPWLPGRIRHASGPGGEVVDSRPVASTLGRGAGNTGEPMPSGAGRAGSSRHPSRWPIASIAVALVALSVAIATLIRTFTLDNGMTQGSPGSARGLYVSCPYQTNANIGDGAITIDIEPGGFVEQRFEAPEGLRVSFAAASVGINKLITNADVAGPIEITILEDGIPISTASTPINLDGETGVALEKKVIITSGRTYSLRVENTSGQIFSPFVKPATDQRLHFRVNGLTGQPLPGNHQLSGEICGE